MPNYDFKCPSCLKITESYFPITDGPASYVVCECGKEASRVYQPTPAHLKGGGWGGK